MKNKIKTKLNLYRGIYGEVAKEEGVTPQAIWNAVNVHSNLRIIEIVAKKAEQRKKAYEKSMRILSQC